MKIKQNLTVAIIALLSITVISTSAWAKNQKAACPAGLTGTWVGGAGNDIHWFAAHTSDSLDPTKGEMILNWTYIKPSFIGGINSGLILTPGHGVWKLNSDGDYDYTWYAYAIDPLSGNIFATIRVSGVALLRDPDDPTVPNCDTAYIYYHFDIAEGEAMILNAASFTEWEEGGAVQMRVPLEVTPLPEQ